MECQNWDPSLRSQSRRGRPRRYLALMSLSHSPPSSRKIRQTHLSIRALLNWRDARIPMPPTSLGAQMSAHLTIWYFWRPKESCQKNLDNSLSNVPCTPSGRRYMPIIYMGRLDRQESIKTVLLPFEVNLPRQGSDLERTLSASGSRSLIRILVSRIGIPR